MIICGNATHQQESRPGRNGVSCSQSWRRAGMQVFGKRPAECVLAVVYPEGVGIQETPGEKPCRGKGPGGIRRSRVLAATR